MAKDTPASVNNSGRERIAAGKQRRLYTLSATTSELSSAFFLHFLTTGNSAMDSWIS